MIPIKEHNDIVEKLMKQIDKKDFQLKTISKEKGKTSSHIPQLQPNSNQQALTKKINQLNKEHKDRVNTMTQQLRNKSLENKELKQRLTLKQNMEAKEKQHIAQIMKKNYDRKPSSGADYKISALIAHYQAEIDKKSKYIDSLHKKMKELQQISSKEISLETMSNQNYRPVNENENKGISLTEHQKQMSRVRFDLQKYKKLFEEKDKEYRDLSRRYSELTKQYYKIVNSYGIQDTKPKPKGLSSVKSDKNIGFSKKAQSKAKPNALQNLLSEMVCSESQPEEVVINKRTFASKVASIETQCHKLQQQNEEDEEEENTISYQERQNNQFAVMKLEQILEELNLSDTNDIVPCLVKLKANLKEYNLVDTIARSLQVFFYNIGKGKMTKNQLVEALEELELSHNRNLQAVDILDEVCIEAGAKRQKLREKIRQLVGTSQEYYGKLKSIKFMQDLAKGNKVVEFIQFFQLDREELELPQQLIKIQEQLKSIDKFIKECRIILEIGDSSSQEVLSLVLRYLQKTSALVSQLQTKKSKKKDRVHE